MLLNRIFTFCLIATAPFSAADAQSVLATGEWFKFSVEKEGVYRLTYTDLVNAGLSPGDIAPSAFRIYGNEGGMLPQKNSEARPEDLQETAIHVMGGDDGIFHTQDYILFYAYGPDDYHYNEEEELFHYTQNKYSKKNFYFLTFSEDPGREVAVQPDLGHEFEVIDTYTDFYLTEAEDINILHSGREWYGRLNSAGNKTITLPFNNLDPEGTTKIFADVLGQTLRPSKFMVTLDGSFLGDIEVDSIRDYNNPDLLYHPRGKAAQKVFTVQNTELNNNPEFQIQFEKKDVSVSRGYYNQLLIQADRKLVYQNSPMLFITPTSKDVGLATYEIQSAASGLLLWDITDGYDVKNQEYTLGSNEIIFGTVGGEVKKFALFNPLNLASPRFIGRVENQNIKSLSAPDLLIIAPDQFVAESNRLAAFRNTHNGLDVTIVNLDKIYNEFSSGRQDVTAIRDFIRHLYDQNSQKLKYILLIGKASYDYLDYTDNNTNFLPTYQSYNSLHPLYTYSSDDYYGFLEDNEGVWEENSSGNHTLDVSIGRLPVTTAQELKNVVDKLIHYSSDESTLGKWRTRILFVADDEDNNTHHRQSNELAEFVKQNINKLHPDKFFLGTYEQNAAPTVEKASKAQQELMENLNKGALIVNYTGHGGEKQWAQEEILTIEDVQELDNINQLPLFVTATCDFGRHDDPLIKSGGELVVLNPAGGGIGIVTTSRPVYSFSNFSLNTAFFDALESNIHQPILGEIFKQTKNNSLINVNNRNFTLLGDPSMKLNVPDLKVVPESISQTDTLKALEEVQLNGKVINESGDVVNDFQGVVDILISDKPVDLTTHKEGETSEFTYKADKSYIYRGKATVADGLFNATFFVPADIDHRIGSGRISFYAREDNSIRDAAGTNNILIGGTGKSDRMDNQPPLVSAYLEDSTFREGDIVGSNTLLIARLEDESGINITGKSFDGGITAVLDDDVFALNDHFTSDVDDFTSGWLIFPLNDLPSGEHILTLKVSDSYNNITSVQLRFTVADDRQLQINELINYPNPAQNITSFVFTHNRAGEPLEGDLKIYNSRGENVLDFKFETQAGQVRHKILDWNCRGAGQSKLEDGLYYYSINVRSKKDGAAAEKFQKLILIN